MRWRCKWNYNINTNCTELACRTQLSIEPVNLNKPLMCAYIRPCADIRKMHPGEHDMEIGAMTFCCCGELRRNHKTACHNQLGKIAAFCTMHPPHPSVERREIYNCIIPYIAGESIYSKTIDNSWVERGVN